VAGSHHYRRRSSRLIGVRRSWAEPLRDHEVLLQVVPPATCSSGFVPGDLHLWRNSRGVPSLWEQPLNYTPGAALACDDVHAVKPRFADRSVLLAKVFRGGMSSTAQLHAGKVPQQLSVRVLTESRSSPRELTPLASVARACPMPTQCSSGCSRSSGHQSWPSARRQRAVISTAD
jgi:hypothetical protein